MTNPTKVPEAVRDEFMKFWPDPGPALRAAIDKYNELLLGAGDQVATAIYKRGKSVGWTNVSSVTPSDGTVAIHAAIDSVMRGES